MKIQQLIELRRILGELKCERLGSEKRSEMLKAIRAIAYHIEGRDKKLVKIFADNKVSFPRDGRFDRSQVDTEVLPALDEALVALEAQDYEVLPFLSEADADGLWSYCKLTTNERLMLDELVVADELKTE